MRRELEDANTLLDELGQQWLASLQPALHSLFNLCSFFTLNMVNLCIKNKVHLFIFLKNYYLVPLF